MKIGIPRALSYFDYFPLWQTFFKGLGFETVISSPTNKEILNKGVSLCVDDACLPVKLFHGHVADLVGRVDVIFIPRLISISPGEFICPKFIGLPEMIKNSINDLPPLLILNYDLHKDKKDHSKAFYDLGQQLGADKRRIIRAYREAMERQSTLEMVLEAGHNPLAILHPRERWADSPHARGTIGVLGHPYLLYDRYLSMDMIKRIYDYGYNVRVPANVPESRIEYRLKGMPKKLFWTYGKRILGSGMDWLEDNRIDGLVYLSSFACGIDSFIEELLRRYNNRGRKLPYAGFILDEHSGQAGFETRLEAFLDMMEWRNSSSGSYLSSHG